MEESLINSVYDEEYYSKYGLNFKPYLINSAVIRVLDSLAKALHFKVRPKTHFDIGCAMGHLTSSMLDLGVESHGIDASRYAIENAVVKARRFVSCKPIESIDPYNVEQRYDLVTCVEVIEHLPVEEEERALDILCALSDNVFFSSAEDYADITHINVHPFSYWRGKFVERGYIDDGFIFPYLPHGRLFVRATDYKQLKNLLDSETRGIVLKRDNFQCVLCEKVGVQVHEIIPRSAFGKRSMQMCYEERNRVCLCPECHAYAHTTEMRKRLFAVMIQKYSYQYQEQEFAKYLGD
jgi:hypothetical protein